MRQKATLFPHSLSLLLLPFALSTLRQKVSLFMSDHLFCHTVRAHSYPIWPSTPFFHSFYLLYFLCFFLALSIRPNTPSSASTSCCFRNFMVLTNLSLSGLLFSQGVPWRETTTSLPHPSTRLHLMCLLLMIN